jgi:peptidoglycan/LPS O-acetylase OafA/YrhL
MRYRPDVDGLRAVAVVPVVLYHLGIRAVPGGFVGVDIFFVISGYLITRLISEEIDSGRYSITGFYVRRARRIFPALFFMCACCMVFALVEYLPDEIESFRNSLVATTLFGSNIYFYLTQGYFAPKASTIPLLHTWSLAVEEQFYVVFPLLLLFLRRKVASFENLILWALVLTSLATSAWLVEQDANAAFYLPLSRAWELLIGSLVALDRLPAVRGRALAETLGAVGLGLILYSIFGFNHRTPFPGLAALAPCVGAALVIHAGKEAKPVSSRLLALEPVRFVGLISYSLYLWHWPIDVAMRVFVTPLTLVNKLEALVGSFGAAVASWKWVEQPFRRGPFRLRNTGSLVTAGAAMAALLLIAVVLPPASIRRWNLTPEEQAVLAVETHDFGQVMRAGKCFLTGKREANHFDEEACLHLSTTRANYLILGDSHAADLWPGLSRMVPDVNLMQATASGCKPLLHTTGADFCTDLMEFMFTQFLPKHHVQGILLSGRWLADDADRARETVEALGRYADRVVLLGPAIEYQHPLPRTVVVSMDSHDPSWIERDRAVEVRLADRVFARRMANSPARYFSLYDAICPETGCLVFDSAGMPVEFDTDHFTLNGSIEVARRLRAAGIFGGVPKAAELTYSDPTEPPTAEKIE